MTPESETLTRDSLIRLRAIDSEDTTETTWGDFIDANGLSFEEIADIRTKLIAGRKAVIGGGGAPVLTVFWPELGIPTGHRQPALELWEVMPCPEHKGKHPFHDRRWIVTKGTQIEHGPDPRSWDVSNGSLICEMRDGPPANARLIASAPEMLAALNRADHDLSELLASRKLDSTDAPFHAVRTARERIRAAISKATL